LLIDAKRQNPLDVRQTVTGNKCADDAVKCSEFPFAKAARACCGDERREDLINESRFHTGKDDTRIRVGCHVTKTGDKYKVLPEKTYHVNYLLTGWEFRL
jgi:hypothetical protein